MLAGRRQDAGDSMTQGGSRHEAGCKQGGCRQGGCSEDAGMREAGRMTQGGCRQDSGMKEARDRQDANRQAGMRYNKQNASMQAGSQE